MTDAAEPAPESAADQSAHDFGFRRAAAKVREFPQKPGVYLMKDAAGRVIYVGKANNLRAARAAIFPSRPPKSRGPRIGSTRSATSTTSSATAKSTPCWSSRG